MVVFQMAIGYYVYKKLALLKTFKPFGVGINTLYMVGLFLSPVVFPFLVISLLVEMIRSLFRKKKAASMSVDDMLKNFGGGKV